MKTKYKEGFKAWNMAQTGRSFFSRKRGFLESARYYYGMEKAWKKV